MIDIQARIVLFACHALALHDIWTSWDAVNFLALKQLFANCWDILTRLSPPKALGDSRLSELRLAHVTRLLQFVRYLLLAVMIIVLCFARELRTDGQVTMLILASWIVSVRVLSACPLTEKRLDCIFVLWSVFGTISVFGVGWKHFMLTHAIRALVRALVSVVYMKTSYSAVINFFYMALAIWRYKVEINTALGDELQPPVGTLFCIFELIAWICITSLCLITQMWFTQFLQNETSLISANHASERLLSGLCDSVVGLDHDLNIREATPHLGHLMCPTTPIDPHVLEGSLFSEYLATESDRESFEAFISGTRLFNAEQDCDQSAATALRTRLHHVHGNEISVDLFHVQSIDVNHKVKHVVGIREVRNAGASPDESLFQGNKTSFRHLSACANADSDDKDKEIGYWCRHAYERSEASLKNKQDSCVKSSSSSASSASIFKRYLPGLHKVRFSVDFLDGEVVVQEYMLAYNRLEGFPDGAPDLASCLMFENMPGFKGWLQESMNKLLNRDAQQIVYPGQVLFRPPTAACASSKVLLLAASASLRWSSYKIDFPDQQKQRLIQLQLYNIAQVNEQRRKFVRRERHEELASLSESKVEPSHSDTQSEIEGKLAPRPRYDDLLLSP